jgi:Ca2+-dependent lipid-binding protein
LEIKAELTALSGKIRFKILTAPEIPFISKATIAFTRVPKIETGVMPLSKHLNIMNVSKLLPPFFCKKLSFFLHIFQLPTIKTLVNEGIKLGFADLVDPKSMTIDVRALVGAFTQDTNAIGVVKVEVREASRDPSLQLQGKRKINTIISVH